MWRELGYCSSQIALVAEGQPVIHEIVVTEAEKQQARSSTAEGNADESGSQGVM
jgi:hypothetical protein